MCKYTFLYYFIKQLGCYRGAFHNLDFYYNISYEEKISKNVKFEKERLLKIDTEYAFYAITFVHAYMVFSRIMDNRIGYISKRTGLNFN